MREVEGVELAQAQQIAVLQIGVEEPLSGQAGAVVVDRGLLLEVVRLLQVHLQVCRADLAARRQVDRGLDPVQIVEVAHH